MPSNPCKLEKKKFNELFDRVRELSDAVDELRAEVDAMKISIVASNVCLTEKGRRDEANTLQTLKRCLEKSFVPVVSKDRTYKVRQKCQQIFSKFPTIISRPTHSPGNERSIKFLHRTEAGRRKEDAKCRPLRRHDAGNPREAKLSHISPASLKRSENSPTILFDSKKSQCVDERCNSPESSTKIDNSEQPRKKIVKKKTTGTDTSFSTAPTGSTPGKKIIDPEIAKQPRSVTFVDRKNVSPKNNSSSDFSLSSGNTSEQNLHDCPVVCTHDENNSKVKKAVRKESTKKKKKSRSAQCSITCEYLDKLPSGKKDAYARTLPEKLHRKDKISKQKNCKRSRKKNWVTHETQTAFELDEEEMYLDGRKKYCRKCNRSSLSTESPSSLTSCSPRSISSFRSGSDDLGESSTNGWYSQEPKSERIRVEEMREPRVFETETNRVGKVKLFRSRKSAKEFPTEEKKSKLQNVRKKRTYVISSDNPVIETEETVHCNSDQEQQNYSVRDSMSQDEKLKQRKYKNKRKKHERKEGAPAANKNVQSSVCTNRPTKRFQPKVEPPKNWKICDTRKKPTKLMKFYGSTSSSSRQCTDETCSLTSEPTASRSDGSITSAAFDPKEVRTRFPKSLIGK